MGKPKEIEEQKTERWADLEPTPATWDALDKVEEAEAALVAARAAKDGKGRKKALSDIAKYRRRADLGRARQADDTWQRAAEAETRALASGRGERIDQATVYAVQGETAVRVQAMRVISRDSVAVLVKRKSITEQEAKACMAYRLLFEEAGKGAGLGSQLEDRPRAVRSTSHGAVAHGLFKAYTGLRLTQIDKAVLSADTSGKALNVLRRVAGEGMPLNPSNAGNKTKAANLARLKLAVETVRSILAYGSPP